MNPVCDPSFTKTSDSFDLVAKLFDIITKQGDKAFDEGHTGKDPYFLKMQFFVLAPTNNPSTWEKKLTRQLSDDCLRLPSQVMIPPLNLLTRARGVSPLAVASSATTSRAAMSFEFSVEPEAEAKVTAAAVAAHAHEESARLEGAMKKGHLIDCLRQSFLGKNPYSVKMNTRSCAVTAADSTTSALGVAQYKQPRERSWLRCCPCGNWTIKYLDHV